MESDAVAAKRLVKLVGMIADGDRQAFAELYDATVARVYGMARRVLVDTELSEDAVQETYLQVWRGAGQYSPASGSVMSWLLVIAHRRAVDAVRREQARTKRESLYEASAASVAHESVDEETISVEESRQVRDCLESLTSAQQESVELAYYGGLTYREVASRLGAGLPAIKSRIRDGLIRLKKCLGVGDNG